MELFDIKEVSSKPKSRLSGKFRPTVWAANMDITLHTCIKPRFYKRVAYLQMEEMHTIH